MNNSKISPFDRIAIGLSGGGYRATAFHLGVLSYLSHLNYKNNSLLQSVKLISTVSGGTFTGLVYAQQLANGNSFKDCYTHLYNILKEVNLVDEALNKLKAESKWNNPYKKRNLINAFAELYDEHFTAGDTFDLFKSKLKNTHLEELIFNATEFNTGNAFRFKTKAKFGSPSFSKYNKYQKSIKLADIIAASSCFPAGFEPLKYPHDFRHSKSEDLNEAVANNPDSAIALMDGGIVDNQGIESLLNYSSNQHEHLKPGLFIICDVGSPNVSPFEFNDLDTKGLQNRSIAGINKTVLKRIKTFNIIATLTGLAAAFMFLYFAIKNIYLIALLFSIIICSVICLIALAILKRHYLKQLKNIKTKVQSSLTSFYRDKLKASELEHLELSKLVNPVLDRLESVLLMTSTIFLKRIRTLSYEKLYGDEQFKFKRISILIKSLKAKDSNQSKSDYQSNKINPNLRYCPDVFKKKRSTALGKAATTISESSDFGTQLWFDDKNAYQAMLDKLISNGQMNSCYFIIKYILNLKDKPTESGYNLLSANDKRQISKLFEQCLNDWEKFRTKPYYNIF